MNKLSKEKMAEKAFKGLGLSISTATGLYHDVILGSLVMQTFNYGLSKEELKKEFIYSWPMPTCLGLIIEDANKRGWELLWTEDKNMHGTVTKYVQFKGLEKEIAEGQSQRRPIYTDRFTRDISNPMYQVVAAYCELLDIDARQGEEAVKK